MQRWHSTTLMNTMQESGSAYKCYIEPRTGMVSLTETVHSLKTIFTPVDCVSYFISQYVRAPQIALQAHQVAGSSGWMTVSARVRGKSSKGFTNFVSTFTRCQCIATASKPSESDSYQRFPQSGFPTFLSSALQCPPNQQRVTPMVKFSPGPTTFTFQCHHQERVPASEFRDFIRHKFILHTI